RTSPVTGATPPAQLAGVDQLSFPPPPFQVMLAALLTVTRPAVAATIAAIARCLRRTPALPLVMICPLHTGEKVPRCSCWTPSLMKLYPLTKTSYTTQPPRFQQNSRTNIRLNTRSLAGGMEVKDLFPLEFGRDLRRSDVVSCG